MALLSCRFNFCHRSLELRVPSFGFHGLRAAGNPLKALRLILHSAIVTGQIVDACEEPEDGDDGCTHWYHGVTYTFRLPDGRQFRGGGQAPGRLSAGLSDPSRPVTIEVEYYPAVQL